MPLPGNPKLRVMPGVGDPRRTSPPGPQVQGKHVELDTRQTWVRKPLLHHVPGSNLRSVL